MKETWHWETMDTRMFDFKNYYTQVAERLKDGCLIAEVGLSVGTSAIMLAETLLSQGKTFHMVMVDNLDYGKTDQLQEIIRNVCRARVQQYVEILPIDSLLAATRYPDESFDFVFLDSSHKYLPTCSEIRCWYPKIKEGGILAGHDYNECEEVRLAVNYVIPSPYTRPPIPNQQTFLPEKLLNVEDTERNYGVWWLYKKFYVKLN